MKIQRYKAGTTRYDSPMIYPAPGGEVIKYEDFERFIKELNNQFALPATKGFLNEILKRWSIINDEGNLVHLCDID